MTFSGIILSILSSNLRRSVNVSLTFKPRLIDLVLPFWKLQKLPILNWNLWISFWYNLTIRTSFLNAVNSIFYHDNITIQIVFLCKNSNDVSSPSCQINCTVLTHCTRAYTHTHTHTPLKTRKWFYDTFFQKWGSEKDFLLNLNYFYENLLCKTVNQWNWNKYFFFS